MDIAQGTFYNHILRNKRENATYAQRRKELREQIQQVYDENNRILGAKKIAAILRDRGVRVSDEMVLELMREMGIASIRQSTKKIYDRENEKDKNLVNCQFDAEHPNQVWVSDVTLFNYKQKHFYICVIMDLFARRVVGHMISHRNSTHLVKMAFQKAYNTRKPEKGLIFHTDRGTNYRSTTFSDYLAKLNIDQSFSKAHTPYDNSVMESFFASMKQEELYRAKYRSEKEVKEAINTYMIFYNERRPHAKLKYKTPSQKEAEYEAHASKEVK